VWREEEPSRSDWCVVAEESNLDSIAVAAMEQHSLFSALLRHLCRSPDVENVDDDDIHQASLYRIPDHSK
jgi:hypothetical protein